MLVDKTAERRLHRTDLTCSGRAVSRICCSAAVRPMSASYDFARSPGPQFSGSESRTLVPVATCMRIRRAVPYGDGRGWHLCLRWRSAVRRYCGAQGLSPACLTSSDGPVGSLPFPAARIISSVPDSGEIPARRRRRPDCGQAHAARFRHRQALSVGRGQDPLPFIAGQIRLRGRIDQYCRRADRRRPSVLDRHAGEAAKLTCVSQACERIYRSR